MSAYSELTRRQKVAENIARSADARRKLLRNFQKFDSTSRVRVEDKYVCQGGFGDVYRGTYAENWLSIVKVAVKKVHQGLAKEAYQKHFEVRSMSVLIVAHLSHVANIIQGFVRETQIWSELEHRNILPFIGYTLEIRDGLHFMSLVSEWMENGTVLDYVKKAEGKAVILHLVRATSVAVGLADSDLLTY